MFRKIGKLLNFPHRARLFWRRFSFPHPFSTFVLAVALRAFFFYRLHSFIAKWTKTFSSSETALTESRTVFVKNTRLNENSIEPSFPNRAVNMPVRSNQNGSKYSSFKTSSFLDKVSNFLIGFIGNNTFHVSRDTRVRFISFNFHFIWLFSLFFEECELFWRGPFRFVEIYFSTLPI